MGHGLKVTLNSLISTTVISTPDLKKVQKWGQGKLWQGGKVRGKRLHDKGKA